MSVFPGGIFSKARGKTAGIVFSAARTRQGKMMTSRELVIPANPQTPIQQSNRVIFDYCQKVVRDIGPGVYRVGFNRGVQDLPGWQSLISLVRRQFFEFGTGEWRAILENSDTLLGDLHFPDTATLSLVGSDKAKIVFSTENGSNGQSTDQIVMGGSFRDVMTNEEETFQGASAMVNRSAGEVEIEFTAGQMDAGCWAFCYAWNENNVADIQRSVAKWFYLPPP